MSRATWPQPSLNLPFGNVLQGLAPSLPFDATASVAGIHPEPGLARNYAGFLTCSRVATGYLRARSARHDTSAAICLAAKDRPGACRLDHRRHPGAAGADLARIAHPSRQKSVGAAGAAGMGLGDEVSAGRMRENNTLTCGVFISSPQTRIHTEIAEAEQGEGDGDLLPVVFHVVSGLFV